MLADQPLLTTTVIDLLIERYEQGGALSLPLSPLDSAAIRYYLAGAISRIGDSTWGPGSAERSTCVSDEIAGVEVASEVLVDIDTPDAYRALLGQADIHTSIRLSCHNRASCQCSEVSHGETSGPNHHMRHRRVP